MSPPIVHPVNSSTISSKEKERSIDESVVVPAHTQLQLHHTFAYHPSSSTTYHLIVTLVVNKYCYVTRGE